MKFITVSNFPITLGQFLKLACIAQDGIEAKMMIQEGIITVNGVTTTQRGKKLQENDIVVIRDVSSLKLVGKK